jgi:hypothetical protein
MDFHVIDGSRDVFMHGLLPLSTAANALVDGRRGLESLQILQRERAGFKKIGYQKAR